MRYLPLVLLLVPAIVDVSTMQACYKYEYPVPDAVQEKCLATMIYGEARGEAEQGKVAVAYTALNRAAKKTVCAVVLAPFQYSIFNNNPVLHAVAQKLDLDPNLKNIIDLMSWEQSIKVARAVLMREVPDPTNGATHYLAPKVMKTKKYRYPKWTREYTQVAVIDNHRFYKR